MTLPGLTAPVRRIRAVAVAVMALAVLDLLSLAMLHLLRRDVDPVTRPTSDYGHGSWGWLMLAATAGVGLAAFALAVTVGRGLDSTTTLRLGLRLLGIVGIAELAQAFFPIDLAGETTTSGLMHNILGNLAFFALPPAAVIIAVTWAKAGRPYGALLRWTAVALAVATVAALAIGEGFGITQRIYLILATGWLGVAALAVLHTTRSAAQVPADDQAT
jgi:hypothetical protein